MKIIIALLLATAGTGSAFAGFLERPPTLPDGGTSILLLGIGLAGLGVVRRAVRR